MTSQLGKQTLVIHILPYISRITENQTMKFDQLIEYNIRSIFVGPSYPKCDGEAIPRPLSKNKHLAYLWINSLKFYSCFLWYAKLNAI